MLDVSNGSERGCIYHPPGKSKTSSNTGSVKVMVSSFQVAEGNVLDGTSEDHAVGCAGFAEHPAVAAATNTINNHTLKRLAVNVFIANLL
jgi:hypothetical protein